jgi:hypothetical protein
MTDKLLAVPDLLTGRCMCGSVRFKLNGKPQGAGLCHCDRCRPQSGSAFSAFILANRVDFSIEGETKTFEDIGASGLHVSRRYCPNCGSPLTTEADVMPTMMFVKVGTIDRNEWFQPQLELFVGKRRPWVSPVPGVPQFEGNPPI